MTGTRNGSHTTKRSQTSPIESGLARSGPPTRPKLRELLKHLQNVLVKKTSLKRGMRCSNSLPWETSNSNSTADVQSSWPLFQIDTPGSRGLPARSTTAMWPSSQISRTESYPHCGVSVNIEPSHGSGISANTIDVSVVSSGLDGHPQKSWPFGQID